MNARGRNKSELIVGDGDKLGRQFTDSLDPVRLGVTGTDFEDTETNFTVIGTNFGDSGLIFVDQTLRPENPWILP